MARVIRKLTALRVANETRAGLHGDGGGLYLRVSDTGRHSAAFCRASTRATACSDPKPISRCRPFSM